jgi:hypothetical protein
MEAYLKKVEDWTWRLISRLWNIEHGGLSQECETFNTELISRKYRTEHGGLSEDCGTLNTEAYLKKRGLNMEAYVKNVKHWTRRRISRMQRTELEGLSKECETLNTEAYFKNAEDWTWRLIWRMWNTEHGGLSQECRGLTEACLKNETWKGKQFQESCYQNWKKTKIWHFLHSVQNRTMARLEKLSSMLLLLDCVALKTTSLRSV